MDIILRKFRANKIRFAFDSEDELKDLLIYLSKNGFSLVASIDTYVETAIRCDAKTLSCEHDNLFTSSIIREGIRYVSYKEFFGPKYSMPSKKCLMEFLGE